MVSSSLRNMTPQSIARLCASSQIEFGEGSWREEEIVVFCPPADTVGEFSLSRVSSLYSVE